MRGAELEGVMSGAAFVDAGVVGAFAVAVPLLSPTLTENGSSSALGSVCGVFLIDSTCFPSSSVCDAVVGSSVLFSALAGAFVANPSGSPSVCADGGVVNMCCSCPSCTLELCSGIGCFSVAIFCTDTVSYSMGAFSVICTFFLSCIISLFPKALCSFSVRLLT